VPQSGIDLGFPLNMDLKQIKDSPCGKIDWRAGMQILKDVSQKGTTWSVVYSLPTKYIVSYSFLQIPLF